MSESKNKKVKMKVGVIAAMSTERKQIAQLLTDKKEKAVGNFQFIEGRMGVNTVILMESGIGKVNAAIGVVEMIHAYTPDCIINTGVAGGVDASLKVMDVVVGKQVCYHDVWCGEGNEYGQVQGFPLYYVGNDKLYALATSVKGDVSVRGGLICTGDQFISDHDQLAVIKGNFPEALAVDMESASMAQTCHAFGVPFLSFRILSDTPGNDNRFDQYLNFWETVAEKSFQVTEAFLSSLPESL